MNFGDTGLAPIAPSLFKQEEYIPPRIGPEYQAVLPEVGSPKSAVAMSSICLHRASVSPLAVPRASVSPLNTPRENVGSLQDEFLDLVSIHNPLLRDSSMKFLK